jgi:hypothetical protein
VRTQRLHAQVICWGTDASGLFMCIRRSLYAH